MKTLYIDCGMGCAGDMLTAALLELHPSPDSFLEKMNTVLGERVTVTAFRESKCGIMGTHVSVRVDGEEETASDAVPGLPGNAPAADVPGHLHAAASDGTPQDTATVLPHAHPHSRCTDPHTHEEPLRHHSGHPHSHTGINDILDRINAVELPQQVKNDAIAVYRLIAEAESAVHGHPVEHIHFHEVGSLDALADVLNVCTLIHELNPDRICASAVNAGSGHVHCAHGILPVPAPATERILRGIPWYSGQIRAELCTPTGAALLKHFVSEFGPMPPMRISNCGYGTGKKDFDAANVVRVLLGDVTEDCEQILELACNLDDMTPEELGFAMERLMAAGALDVYFTNIGMKKCRPAVMLTCMCKFSDRDLLLPLIFRHTTTLGVREYVCTRHTLRRTERTEATSFGPVRIKSAEGYGVMREKVEYEDLARLARENSCSLPEIRKGLEKT